MRGRILAAAAAVLGVLFARRARATPTTAAAPRAAEPLARAPSADALEPFGTPLGLSLLFGRADAVSPISSDTPHAGDEIPTPPSVLAGGGAIAVPQTSVTTVPRLELKPNAGQVPKPPPLGIYQRYPQTIARFVLDVNTAARGLRVGLNSWWRHVDDGIGEELGQHHLGVAIDFQGPDQETLAQRLRERGYTVLDRGNDGKLYNHRHAQLERRGYLARLGVTADDLRRWSA